MHLKNKKAFTLAEILVVLLIMTVVLAASMPLITVMHIPLPKRIPHGKWACTLISGTMHSATAANSNASLPGFNSGRWKEGCTFPKLPKNVDYVTVQVIGGGGGGGSASLQATADNKTITLPADKDYKITSTGTYRITVKGMKGQHGYINPDDFTPMINGKQYGDTCTFKQAPACEFVVSLQYDADLKQNDILKITKGDNEENVDAKNAPLCPPGVQQIKYTDTDGNEQKVEYSFQKATSLPGADGGDKSLSINGTTFFTINGSGGGYYTSSTGCTIECSGAANERFTARYDRSNLTDTTHISDYYESKVSVTPTIIKDDYLDYIESLSYGYSYSGGGGDAGQTHVQLIDPDQLTNLTIEIGAGGSAGKAGGDTTFAGVTASGGAYGTYWKYGCSTNTENGSDGDNMAGFTLDSSAGTGGKGQLGGASAPVNIDGGDATGLGAGGGGAGLWIKTSFATIAAYLKNFGINSGTPNMSSYYQSGGAGSGAAGGVIVSSVAKTQKNAFSLAEVLIVLIIIGVLSLITLAISKPKAVTLRLLYYEAYYNVAVAAYNSYHSAIAGGTLQDTFQNKNGICNHLIEYINITDASENVCKGDAITIGANMTFPDSAIQFTASNGMVFYMSDTFQIDNFVDDDKYQTIVWVDLDGVKLGSNTAVWTEKNPSDIVAFAITGLGDVIPLGYPKIDKRYVTGKLISAVENATPVIGTLYNLQKQAFNGTQYEYEPLSYNYDQTGLHTSVNFITSPLKITDTKFITKETASQLDDCKDNDTSFPSCSIDIIKAVY